VIVRELHLSNFRSFREGHLTFAGSQNYIFGSNWQGKSSIVEAIAFALFGSQVIPRKFAGAAVKAEHLLTDGAERGSVRLTFDVGSREYTIKRSLPPKTVSLYRDGVQIATSIRGVDEQIADMLGVDAKLFLSVFYADQDELRRSLDFSPEDRRRFVEGILGQELWRERVDALRGATRATEELVRELVSGKFGIFVAELDRLTAEISERRQDLRDLAKEVRGLGKALPSNIKVLRREEQVQGGQIARLQQERAHLRHSEDLALGVIASLRKGVCPTCTQPVAPKLRASRITALRQQVKENATSLRQIEQQVQKLERTFEAAGFDQASEGYVSLARLRAEESALSKIQKSDEAREKKLRAQSKIFGKKPEHLERARDELDFLARLEATIQEYRASLRMRLVEQLAVAMNDFLGRFHDGDNDAAAVIDADLNLSVRIHGREVPLSNLSGAAKDIFALALRHGLMRVAARGIEFLILDEPTRHMDISNVRRLKALFDDLGDRQLIVVTVHEEFAAAAGKHFVVAKDANFFSTIAAA
jgi:exonuclease SbcC